MLVTGGTGFLGRHLIHRLVKQGAQVTVALEEGQAASWTQGVAGRAGDVRRREQVSHLVKTTAPEIIFHLAAVGVNDPFIAAETALQVNVQGTINLLRAAQEAKSVGRVVVAGTSYEYGEDGALDPGNVYAASKVAAWAFCRMYYRAHGTPVVLARPFNVYGPGQNERALIPAAIRAALDGQDFLMTPGEQERDFIYVDDLIQGFLAVATAEGIGGQSLDLGTGCATPVREVVARVFALTASQGCPQIGARPYRPGVVWKQVADAERTAQLTGWRAKTGLDRGLKATIEAMTGE